MDRNRSKKKTKTLGKARSFYSLSQVDFQHALMQPLFFPVCRSISMDLNMYS